MSKSFGMPRVTQSDVDALLATVRAIISVNGGECHSVAQLAGYVTKASRFLFMTQRYSKEAQQDMMARESEAIMLLAREYVRPVQPREIDV